MSLSVDHNANSKFPFKIYTMKDKDQSVYEVGFQWNICSSGQQVCVSVKIDDSRPWS